jgi:two-component system, NarL family, nitrate/nitrite response regulator NarL
MPVRCGLDERAQDQPAEAVEIGFASRPGIFILSGVRLYREGLVLTLGSNEAVEVLGAAAPPDAFARIAELRPEVVVLDSSLDDGLRLSRHLRETVPDVKIVAFAVSGIDQDVIAYAEAGISAFVQREGSPEDLVRAVHQALRGELVCSPRLTALLFSRVAALSAARALTLDGVALTQREKEIVPLVEQGLSNKEIARKLCIGAATIKNHVHNILEKLQVRRRGEVAARMRGELIGAAAALATVPVPDDYAR